MRLTLDRRPLTARCSESVMPANVSYPDNPVNAKCADSAKETWAVNRHNVRMAKRHPIRPHLRAWRIHYGKTLEWVAAALGASHSTVLRWETGENGVQQETFEAIARAYGLTAAELSGPPEDASRARELHRIMTALQALDDRRLKHLASLAEDLAAPKQP
jgi:transcriptional regulator with XRE-family HTH domain